jgi:nucleotide-binding universal stress UspA family protein
MYKKILLAYDGSQSGRTALFECSYLANSSVADIHLIAVVQPVPAAVLYEVVISEVPDATDETEHHRKVLEEHLARGEPVEQICEHAKRLKADLIIVGHRRPKGWAERWWRGSIGATLMDNAPCSVLIAMTGGR